MTEPDKYKPGMLVRHPGKAEWGLGKVLVVQGNKLKVHFKNDEQDFRTLVVEKIPLVIAHGESDPTLKNLPPFLGDRFDVKGKKVRFDDGVQKFNLLFPRGFKDPAYLGSGKLDKKAGERGYKWAAHERYEKSLGEGRGESLLSGGKIDELSDCAYQIVSCELNLLSPYELMAFKDGLGADHAATVRYFEALFAFLRSEELNEALFTELAESVGKLPVEAGKARVATWPVLTILPYLAFPGRFMFLKPEPTNACADRLRFDLQYDSDLRWITYKKLMEMSNDLLIRLQPLGARDYIDVQSFMWVIAKY